MQEKLCDECKEVILIPADTQDHEIFECPCCGLEYEVIIIDKVITLKQVELEGEDWGE